MYIKDTYSGKVREYGTNHHDSLRISYDGTYLTYENLQCGDGSVAGDKGHSGFLFCDDEGHTPDEDEVLCRHGADAYFNIGGFDDTKTVLDKIRAEITDWQTDIHDNEYDAESHDFVFERIFEIIDEYKAESEIGE